jgi:beta-galactosidase
MIKSRRATNEPEPEKPMKKTTSAVLIVLTLTLAASAARAPSFRFKGGEFVLDDKPFRIMAGEIHFQRIPREYWADRLAKVRAAGLNTVCTCVFWNALEPEPGRWDFSGMNDLAAFLRTAQRAELWVVIRPGPYACAEWDFGALPAWLLREPDIKVRCSDPRYMEACGNYIRRLADEVRGLMCPRGGPVLMVQLENEYGSYGNDRAYTAALKKMWEEAGVEGPFYTADGATPHMLEAGTVPGAAIGLDPGTSPKDYAEAEKLGRDVPVFCSEFYPGWLTHWGEKWAHVATEDVVRDLRWLLENRKSFNFYMFHGGTNFGFSAGANFSDRYEPDVTSYDYDAPLDEMGRPTPKYFAIRDVLKEFQPKGTVLPDLPKPLPAIDIPEIALLESASLFDNLPPAVKSPQPRPMESYGQTHGLLLYRTTLVGRRSGKLAITDLHDYANVYVDGQYLGTLDRSRKEAAIDIPKSDPPHRSLDILVEAMGRINFGPLLLDRKGITDRVTLDNMTLMDWEIFPLPLDEDDMAALKFGASAPARPGTFFHGAFELPAIGDTFLDMTGWKKGIVWINGRNLGRYWEIGPQKRFYCPAPFLKTGRNEIVVFDLHALRPATIRGFRAPD